jgi:hypothetical protein
MMQMTKKWATLITGGLSTPSKMPCPAWSISAKRCKTGSILAKRPGTVCHNCYALHGRYAFSNVQEAQERRFNALNHPQWVEAMVILIQDHSYFRWFDSGDIQDEAHWQKIIAVCKRTPNTRHWLPTKEAAFIGRATPNNLTVRYSVTAINGKPRKHFIQSISVTDGTETCPAEKQGNKCRTCRKCWDANIQIIKYKHKYGAAK